MYLVNSVSLYGQITKLHSFLKDTPLQLQFYYKFYSQGILIQKKINLQLTRAGFEVAGLSEFFRTLIATMFGWNGDISAPDSFSACSITISPLTQLTVN